jgi:tetratricopeptide (TPR) repeat protein
MKKRTSLILGVCIFLVAGIPFLAAFAKDKDILRLTSQYIEQGKALYEEKDYYEAVEKWTEVLKVDPWNEEVKLLIEDALGEIELLTEKLDEGFNLLEKGNISEAFETFVYVKNNSSPETRDLYSLLVNGFNSIEQMRNKAIYERIVRKGDELTHTGKYDQALRLFVFAHKFDPAAGQLPRRIEEVKKRKETFEIKQRAIDLFDREDYVASRKAWNELLEIAPYDEDAPIYLSKINFKIQESDRLRALARSYFDNGVNLFRKKQWNEAIDQFENAVAMNYRTDEARDYIERIREEIALQQERERERMTEQVAQYLREGIKYYNLNQYKKSLAALNEGLKLDPENTQIKEYIIRDIIALKREEEKSVPVTSPFYKLIEDLKRLGKESFARGNYSESVKYYEEILLIFPFNEVARINLTKALSETDPVLAREILANMYNEANDLLRRKKQREALIKLKLILEVDPENVQAKNLLNRIESENKEEKRVVSAEERQRAQKLYEDGVELYKMEKLEDAVRVWKEAVDLNPEFVDARVFLSRAESKLRTLKSVASGSSGKQTAMDDELRIKLKKHYLDGINYYMNGMYREAISEWEEIIKIDPEFESVQMNLERARKRLGYDARQNS